MAAAEKTHLEGRAESTHVKSPAWKHGSGVARVVIDADHLLAISEGTLRENVILHMRDDLLSPARRSKGLTLVVTDWQGRMPIGVRAILGELLQMQENAFLGLSTFRGLLMGTLSTTKRKGSPQLWKLNGHGGTLKKIVAEFALPGGLRVTSLDLHGKVEWFGALLRKRRAVFEARNSWLRSLELSVVDEVGELPCFGNLRALRVFQPEFGSAPYVLELLRHNLKHLDEVACVARSTAAPFFAALEELDAPVAGSGDEPEQCEARFIHPTSLRLRGNKALVSQALDVLGVSIARNFELPASEKSFIGRLAELKLELSDAHNTAELKKFQLSSAYKLREERLGKDATVGLRLEVEAKRPKVSQAEAFMCLMDVTSLSLGFESTHGLFCPVLPRNMTIPGRKAVCLLWDGASASFLPGASKDHAVAPPGAASAAELPARRLRIFAGERAFVADNLLVGEVEIRAVGSQVEVVFDLDANDVLSINGVRCRGGQEGDEDRNPLRIMHNITADWIKNHVEQADASALEDQARRRAVIGELGVSGFLGMGWNLGDCA